MRYNIFFALLTLSAVLSVPFDPWAVASDLESSSLKHVEQRRSPDVPPQTNPDGSSLTNPGQEQIVAINNGNGNDGHGPPRPPGQPMAEYMAELLNSIKAKFPEVPESTSELLDYVHSLGVPFQRLWGLMSNLFDSWGTNRIAGGPGAADRYLLEPLFTRILAQFPTAPTMEELYDFVFTIGEDVSSISTLLPELFESWGVNRLSDDPNPAVKDSQIGSTARRVRRAPVADGPVSLEGKSLFDIVLDQFSTAPTDYAFWDYILGLGVKPEQALFLLNDLLLHWNKPDGLASDPNHPLQALEVGTAARRSRRSPLPVIPTPPEGPLSGDIEWLYHTVIDAFPDGPKTLAELMEFCNDLHVDQAEIWGIMEDLLLHWNMPDGLAGLPNPPREKPQVGSAARRSPVVPPPLPPSDLLH